MLLEKTPTSIIIISCLCVIYGLFSVKEQVMQLRSELIEIEKQLAVEEDSIKILKAELAYLSSPQRLQKLGENYLSLKPTNIRQIIADPTAPSIDHQLATDNHQKSALQRSIANSVNVKWRYKRGPDKYVQTVAAKK